jgi:VWFA-related protein
MEGPVHVRGAATAALLLCGAISGRGQAPQNTPQQNAPEMSSHDAAAAFSTKVNLVMVPVVVRDANGKPIGTLQKEDFQLFDKGKPQVISKFSVEKAGEAVIPAEVATDDAALENAARATAASKTPSPIAQRFVIYLFDDVHTSIGDLIQVRNAADHHLSESLDATTRTAIFTTSGLGNLDFTDDRQKLHEALLKLTARPILAQGDLDRRLVLIALEDSIRRLAAVPGDRSLLLVSPGFGVPDYLRQEETDMIDRAIRTDVRISSLDGRGLYTIIPGGDASTPSFQGSREAMIAKMQKQMDTAMAAEGVMEELPDATGGRYFHNNNDLEGGFAQVAAAPEFVYVLGFSPQNLKLDGAYHTLKVKLVTARGLDLQARRGYYAPRHLADPQEDAKREIQEALFSRDELQDIPVELHMQFFKSSDAAAKIAVLARVDLKNLPFRKENGRNNDDLTVLAGLFDQNGNLIKGTEKILELRLLDPTLEKLLNLGVTVRTNFDVAPGSYVIRLVVRDSEGQNMAARNGVVEIP